MRLYWKQNEDSGNRKNFLVQLHVQFTLLGFKSNKFGMKVRKSRIDILKKVLCLYHIFKNGLRQSTLSSNISASWMISSVKISCAYTWRWNNSQRLPFGCCNRFLPGKKQIKRNQSGTKRNNFHLWSTWTMSVLWGVSDAQIDFL